MAAPFALLAVLLLAGFANGLLGIYQHFTGVVPTDPWVDPSQFPELKTRVVGTLINPQHFCRLSGAAFKHSRAVYKNNNR